jgi:hypothetical protein
MALNKEQTQIIAHAEIFAAINDKIKDYDPNAVILSAVSDFQHYFGGGSYLSLPYPLTRRDIIRLNETGNSKLDRLSGGRLRR